MPLSGSSDLSLRSGWSWALDARSVVEPTARVLIACKALTPRDDATRREALRLLRERRCADGGWNFGKATDKGSDLGAYAQTTAIALIALQAESDTLVQPACARCVSAGAASPAASRSRRRSSRSVSTATRARPAPSRRRSHRSSSVARSSSARCRLRGPPSRLRPTSSSSRSGHGHEPDPPSAVVRSCAAAAWVGAGGSPSRTGRGSSTTRPRPSIARCIPKPGGSAVAVLKAERYDADLSGLLLDGLRQIGTDVRGRTVLLKPNFVEFHAARP